MEMDMSKEIDLSNEYGVDPDYSIGGHDTESGEISGAGREDDETAYDTLVRQKGLDNIADGISQQVLDKIGDQCWRGYRVDIESRSQWEERYRDANRLASLMSKRKNTPWENASNVKHPLLTQAAIQFNSRAMPEIVPSTVGIVKTRIIGNDKNGNKAARANRVSSHMSWQLGTQMVNWVEEMDRLTLVVPLVGTAFKKTYYSPEIGENKSDLVLAEDLVMNYMSRSVEDAPRKSQRLWYHPNKIVELERAGLFLHIEYGDPVPFDQDDMGDGINDGVGRPSRVNVEDDDSPQLFVEQHGLLDLDGDGYKEPYIVTFHYDTHSVASIVAGYDIEGISASESGEILKIKAVEYFTKYGFIPSIDGSGVYDMGFGTLMGHTTEAINTSMNQLLDAGHDATAGGGFISASVRIGGGGTGNVKRHFKFSPGAWYSISSKEDIRKSILPRPVSQPSPVLFSLLEYMVNYSEKLMSSTEVLSGQQSLANVPATTTMALIEQGLKVFGAIYKRLHRSLSKEFRKLYRLNRLYLDEEVFFNFHDEDYVVAKDDYAEEDIDIIPVSDPNNVNDAQKLLKSEALMEQRGTGLNDKVIQRRYFEAMQVENIDELFDVPEPPPDPEIEMEQAKLEMEQERLELEKSKFRRDLIRDEASVMKTLAEVELTRAKTIESLAKAEGEEDGRQIEEYKAQAEELSASRDELTAVVKRQMALLSIEQPGNSEEVQSGTTGGTQDDNAGRLQPMEVQPGNDMVYE